MRLALFRRLRGWRRPALLRRRFLAMGTQVTVTLATEGATGEAEAALAAARQAIDDFGEDWWAWGCGRLGALNRQLAAGERVTIPEDMRPLFARAWALHRHSAGRYDPRIGALVRLWGFDDVARVRSAPPSTAEIDALLQDLRRAPPYVDGQAYGPAPAVCWDFGGIAKGWLVDQVLQQLAAAGFPDATVDAGGNLGVRGRRFGEPWRIGIRDPASDPDAPRLLAVLDADDEAVNTHGDDQRGFDWQGQRYGHLLDASSGWPAQGLRALTVVHADGAVAEALGAALYVAGPERWPACAKAWGLEQVLAVTAAGSVQATRRLTARLRPEPGVSLHIVD